MNRMTKDDCLALIDELLESMPSADERHAVLIKSFLTRAWKVCNLIRKHTPVDPNMAWDLFHLWQIWEVADVGDIGDIPDSNLYSDFTNDPMSDWHLRYLYIKLDFNNLKKKIQRTFNLASIEEAMSEPNNTPADPRVRSRKGRPPASKYKDDHIVIGKKKIKIPQNSLIAKACSVFFKKLHSKGISASWEVLSAEINGLDTGAILKRSKQQQIRNFVNRLTLMMKDEGLKPIFGWSRGQVTRLD